MGRDRRILKKKGLGNSRIDLRWWFLFLYSQYIFLSFTVFLYKNGTTYEKRLFLKLLGY